jgi:hypothetical protein
LLLGQVQLRNGDPAGVERVFADAEKLGIDRSQIATEYAQAFYQQGKLKALLDEFSADGLPVVARLDVLLLRAAIICVPCISIGRVTRPRHARRWPR